MDDLAGLHRGGTFETPEPGEDSSAVLDALFDVIEDGIIIYDTAGSVCSATPRALTLLDVTWSALIGSNAFAHLWQVYDVNGRPLADSELPSRISLRTGQNLKRVMLRLQPREGDTKWLSVSTSLLRGRSGRIKGVVASLSDMTDEYSLSARARESEAVLAAILASSMVGIIAIDESHKIITFNGEAERIFGYAAHEIVGRPLDLLVPDAARSRHHGQVERFAREGTAMRQMANWRRISGRRQDGREFPLNVVISRVQVGRRMIFTAILQDMTSVRDHETQLNALLQECEQQLERAQTASAAKSKFLSVMSHELRTPLNAIIGFSEIMQSGLHGEIGNPHYRSYVDDILASGRLLLSIINDILDISRIETGKRDLAMGDLDLGNEVAETCAIQAKVAARNGLAFDLEISAAPVLVQADSRALRQIVNNLLSNAIKFTPAGGRIGITVGRAAETGQPVIRVSDTGIGIPADRLADICQPFVQVSDAHVRSQGGTGLGLAIAQSLARLMGGDLVVRSDFGAGTEVSLLLAEAGNPPIAPAATLEEPRQA